MAGGGPRPTFSMNRSESNPADGGGDGIAVGATAIKSAH